MYQPEHEVFVVTAGLPLRDRPGWCFQQGQVPLVSSGSTCALAWLPAGRATPLLHKPMSSVFSFLIVLRVIWIPRAALSLCHCTLLMVFFLAAALIFLALQSGHLCRHSRCTRRFPSRAPRARPANPNCKGLPLPFLLCPFTVPAHSCSFLFHLSVLGKVVLSSISTWKSCYCPTWNL